MSWRTRFPYTSAVYSNPDGVETIDSGESNTAASPNALPNPAAPDPAIVCTRAVDKSMERMRCPLYSATYKVEKVASRAMPRGWLNVAAVPTPFEPPAAPLPARVATIAVATSMRRMRWFPQPWHPPHPSATNTVPLGCHTAPVGPLNCAVTPKPSAKPATPLPASVETDAEESAMVRTR